MNFISVLEMKETNEKIINKEGNVYRKAIRKTTNDVNTYYKMAIKAANSNELAQDYLVRLKGYIKQLEDYEAKVEEYVGNMKENDVFCLFFSPMIEGSTICRTCEKEHYDHIGIRPYFF